MSLLINSETVNPINYLIYYIEELLKMFRCSPQILYFSELHIYHTNVIHIYYLCMRQKEWEEEKTGEEGVRKGG